MRGGEGGVVAADLGPRLVGLRQEEQVVDGDDLRRAPGRDEQRVRGVDDIPTAGQRFNGGPFRAVPEIIQYPNGHTAVDDAGPDVLRRSQGPADPSTSS